MTKANLTGGSAEDRAAILALHERYIDVNARFDWEKLNPQRGALIDRFNRDIRI